MAESTRSLKDSRIESVLEAIRCIQRQKQRRTLDLIWATLHRNRMDIDLATVEMLLEKAEGLGLVQKMTIDDVSDYREIKKSKRCLQLAPSSILRNNLRNAVLSVIRNGKGGYSVRYIQKLVSELATFDVHEGFDWSRHVRSTCKRLVLMGHLRRVGMRYYLPSQAPGNSTCSSSNSNSSTDRINGTTKSSTVTAVLKNGFNTHATVATRESATNSTAAAQQSKSCNSRNGDDPPLSSDQMRIGGKKRVSFKIPSVTRSRAFSTHKNLRHQNHHLRSCLVKRSRLVTITNQNNNSESFSTNNRARNNAQSDGAKYGLRSRSSSPRKIPAIPLRYQRSQNSLSGKKSVNGSDSKSTLKNGDDDARLSLSVEHDGLHRNLRNCSHSKNLAPRGRPRSSLDTLRSPIHDVTCPSSVTSSPRMTTRNCSQSPRTHSSLPLASLETIGKRRDCTKENLADNTSNRVAKLQQYHMDKKNSDQYKWESTATSTRDCDIEVSLSDESLASSNGKEILSTGCTLFEEQQLLAVNDCPSTTDREPTAEVAAIQSGESSVGRISDVRGDISSSGDMASSSQKSADMVDRIKTKDDLLMMDNDMDPSAEAVNNYSFTSETPFDNSVNVARASYSQYRKIIQSSSQRIRRSQLNMLADNLTKFYAPSSDGKRHRVPMLNRVAPEPSARERQLEVIRKQLSLVAKRQQLEMEMDAAAASGSVALEPIAEPHRTWQRTEVKGRHILKRSKLSSHGGVTSHRVLMERNAIETVTGKTRQLSDGCASGVVKRKRGRPSFASLRELSAGQQNPTDSSGSISAQYGLQHVEFAEYYQTPAAPAAEIVISDMDRQLFDLCHKPEEQPLAFPAAQCSVIGRYELTLRTEAACSNAHVFRSSSTSFICEYCFSHFGSSRCFERHQTKCSLAQVPGNKIYHGGSASVFEVNGLAGYGYCRSLGQLSQCFVRHPTLLEDCAQFVYYVLYVTDDTGVPHYVGFFSKKHGCCMDFMTVLPQYRRQGWGRFIAEICYHVLRFEGCVIPKVLPALDDATNALYRSFCKSLMETWLLNSVSTASDLSVSDISQYTGLAADDILAALKSLSVIVAGNGQFTIDPKIVSLMAASRSTAVHVNAACFQWKSLLHKRPRGRPPVNRALQTPTRCLHSETNDLDGGSGSNGQHRPYSSRGSVSPGLARKSCPCCINSEMQGSPVSGRKRPLAVVSDVNENDRVNLAKRFKMSINPQLGISPGISVDNAGRVDGGDVEVRYSHSAVDVAPGIGGNISPDLPVKRRPGRPRKHSRPFPKHSVNITATTSGSMKTTSMQYRTGTVIGTVSSLRNYHPVASSYASSSSALSSVNAADLSESDDVEPDDCELDFTLASPGIPTVDDAGTPDKNSGQHRCDDRSAAPSSPVPVPIVIDDGDNASDDNDERMDSAGNDDEDNNDDDDYCSSTARTESIQPSCRTDSLPSSSSGRSDSSTILNDVSSTAGDLSPEISSKLHSGAGRLQFYLAPVAGVDWSRRMSSCIPSTATSLSDTLIVSSPSFSLPICSAIVKPSTSLMTDPSCDTSVGNTGFSALSSLLPSSKVPLLSVDDLKSSNNKFPGVLPNETNSATSSRYATNPTLTNCRLDGTSSTSSLTLSSSSSGMAFRLSPCHFSGSVADRLNAVAFKHNERHEPTGAGQTLGSNNNDIVCSVATPVMADVLLRQTANDDLPNRSMPAYFPAVGLPFFGAIRLPDAASLSAFFGSIGSQTDLLGAAARSTGASGSDAAAAPAAAVPMIALINLGGSGFGSLPSFSCAAALIPQGALQFFNMAAGSPTTGNIEPVQRL